MKNFVNKIQDDIKQLQDTVKTVQKEGNDLLKMLKNLDIKSNLHEGKEELEKLIHGKFKKIEPFIENLQKSAEKAGLDVNKIEGRFRETAHNLKQQAENLADSKVGSIINQFKPKKTKPKRKTKAKTKTKTKTKKSRPRKAKTKPTKSPNQAKKESNPNV